MNRAFYVWVRPGVNLVVKVSCEPDSGNHHQVVRVFAATRILKEALGKTTARLAITA